MSLIFGRTCRVALHIAFLKSNVICLTLGLFGILEVWIKELEVLLCSHLSSSQTTKASGTCLTWSSFLTKALTVNNCVNGGWRNLNVASMYQVFDWQRISNCLSDAKIR